MTLEDFGNFASWGVMGGLAVLIVWRFWWYDRRVARWADEGRCAKCGYDLRATKGRCPECGRVPKADGLFNLQALRDEWPASPVEPRKPELHETKTSVHQTDRWPEAALLRDQLKARGILAEIVDAPRTGGVYENLYAPNQGSTYSVLIWSGDAELAEAYLQAIRNEPQPVET